ncbi:MAG: hypothetical protein A2X34_05300 [Elusimicrobia bacterium GWC2_51_8]|nr:MAG: hypothetical protein A2X33_09980 [Elusimicrobia bacterium GWA2_51_34]OGR58032.1 MAG: hypothetical protein A2X34_05300 [Elusimicrobia bacterium GWC2_51_8]
MLIANLKVGNIVHLPCIIILFGVCACKAQPGAQQNKDAKYERVVDLKLETITASSESVTTPNFEIGKYLFLAESGRWLMDEGTIAVKENAVIYIDEDDDVSVGDTFYVLFDSAAPVEAILTNTFDPANTNWGKYVNTSKPLTKVGILEARGKTQLSAIDSHASFFVVLHSTISPKWESVGKKVEFSTFFSTEPIKAYKLVEGKKETWELPYTGIKCFYEGGSYYPPEGLGDDKQSVSTCTMKCEKKDVTLHGGILSITDLDHDGVYEMVLGEGDGLSGEYVVRSFDGEKISVPYRKLLGTISD